MGLVTVKMPRRNIMFDIFYVLGFVFVIFMAYVQFNRIEMPYLEILENWGPVIILALAAISVIFRGQDVLRAEDGVGVRRAVKLNNLNQFIYLMMIVSVFFLSVMGRFGFNKENNLYLFCILLFLSILFAILPFILEPKIRKMLMVGD